MLKLLCMAWRCPYKNKALRGHQFSCVGLILRRTRGALGPQVTGAACSHLMSLQSHIPLGCPNTEKNHIHGAKLRRQTWSVERGLHVAKVFLGSGWIYTRREVGWQWSSPVSVLGRSEVPVGLCGCLGLRGCRVCVTWKTSSDHVHVRPACLPTRLWPLSFKALGGSCVLQQACERAYFGEIVSKWSPWSWLVGAFVSSFLAHSLWRSQGWQSKRGDAIKGRIVKSKHFV